MTATVPRTVPFRLYRFYGHDGGLLYVGVTGRLPFKRLMEHVCDKPWAGEMARWEVDPRTWATEAEVLAVEKATIRAERPKYNWAHNEGNPGRVWAPPIQPASRPAPRRPAPSRPVPGRPGTLWRWLSATLAFRTAVSWLLLALAVCVAVAWGSHAIGHLVPVKAALAAGGVVSTAVHVKFWKTIRRRLRRL